MTKSKKPAEKINLHPRNLHRDAYDFPALVKAIPELKKCITENKVGVKTIKFSDPISVILLNRALLKHHYKIQHWSIPKGFLCPPVPGRADYLHYVADLLSGGSRQFIPKGDKVNIFDIGTGSNLIYPLLANKIYDWNAVGSDVDLIAIENAKLLVKENRLKKAIKIRTQNKKGRIFHDCIQPDEFYDAVICNPPFHLTEKEANKGTERKWKNLGKGKGGGLNFGGKKNELIYPGGEMDFIQKIMTESKAFEKQILWCTTLVAKEAHLPKLQRKLAKLQPKEVKVIKMGQGNKQSRILAWTFLEPKQIEAWKKFRWS